MKIMKLVEYKLYIDRQLNKLNKKYKKIEDKIEKLTFQITQWNRLASYKQLRSTTTLILKPIKTKYKTWIFIVKTAKNTLSVRIQKISLSIRQKAKAKPKCADCLTDRTFFDNINNEHDLEQLLKHFFLYWCIL